MHMRNGFPARQSDEMPPSSFAVTVRICISMRLLSNSMFRSILDLNCGNVSYGHVHSIIAEAAEGHVSENLVELLRRLQHEAESPPPLPPPPPVFTTHNSER